MKRLFLTILILVMFNSCDEFKDKIITPNEFINQVSPESEKYSKDSIELEKQFKKQLLARKDFFQNSSYTDSTIVTVDSIIYSSSLNKLSVFILVTNPTSRQLAPNSKHALYFEGTCYLAIRQKDSMLVKWLGPSFSNSYDKNELREIMRDSYFTESANRKPESDCKYNLNDYRFWDCPIWAKLYSK